MTEENSLNAGVTGFTYNSLNGWAWLFDPGYSKTITTDIESVVGEIVLFPGSGSTKMTAERMNTFEQWLLGWPEWVNPGSGYVLNRNPPLAYEAKYWNDDRATTARRRYKLYAAKIEGVRFAGLRGDDITSYTVAGVDKTWDKKLPAYEVAIYTVRFESPPYEILYRSGPDQVIGTEPDNTIAAGADPAYDGEWSRWTDWVETPSVRVLQLKAGIKWDENPSGYGQPSTLVAANQISYSQGTPKTIGEALVICTWYEVPYYAYDWTKITSRFGTVNDFDFLDSTKAPFRSYSRETLLFLHAERIRKNNVLGEPSYTIKFHFQHSPGPDDHGLWNRLFNSNGEPQRITRDGTNPLYDVSDFEELFTI